MPESQTFASKAILALAIVAATALFCALGIWQLERRAWKIELIHQVDQAIHAPAVVAPGPAEWPALTPAHAYRHIKIHGHLLNNLETPVQAVTDHGAGYWIVTPLKSDDGFIVLINRGFVPTDNKDPATRQAGQNEGSTEITGLLRLTEANGRFLRANDPVAGLWYSRDVAAIAASHGLTDVAPYFIDADATPNPGGLPMGGLTVIAFPNNHLVYAITWFGLAFLCLVSGMVSLRQR